MGRDETPMAGEKGGIVPQPGVPLQNGAGLKGNVAAIKGRIQGDQSGRDRLAAPVVTPDGRTIQPDMVYGSSNGTNLPPHYGGSPTLNSRAPKDIATDQMVLITAAVDQLAPGEVHRVVIVGFSWGGRKAIMVADELNTQLKEAGLDGKVQIHVRTIDPRHQKGEPSQATPKAWSVRSWHNWPLVPAGKVPDTVDHPGGPLVRGVADPLDKHRALPAAAQQQLIDSLWPPNVP